MKLENLICCLLFIYLLYLPNKENTYTQIIDYDKKYNITFNKKIITFDNIINLNINDTITNNINTYFIKKIINNYSVELYNDFIGDPIIFINAKNKQIPKKTKEIHTILITNKIVPYQLYIKQYSAIKWINKNNNIEKIICKDNNNNTIFIGKDLKFNEFDLFVFKNKGKYEYHSVNNIQNINTINII